MRDSDSLSKDGLNLSLYDVSFRYSHIYSSVTGKRLSCR